MTTLKEYPYWPAETPEDVKTQLRDICNTRKDDITQFGNLVNIFMSGRKSGKIPTSSNDVAATDKIGDFNYDTNYWYILVNDSGAGKWRRASLGSW